jgi:hypothetical protein
MVFLDQQRVTTICGGSQPSMQQAVRSIIQLDKAIVCSLNMDSVSANLSPDRVHLLFNPANLFREALIRVTYQLILVCGASNEVGGH